MTCKVHFPHLKTLELGRASVMSNSAQPHRRQPTRLRCPWDSPGKNTGVGCHFPLQQTAIYTKETKLKYTETGLPPALVSIIIYERSSGSSEM